jgi:dihydrolipoamide dehydrogenase
LAIKAKKINLLNDEAEILKDNSIRLKKGTKKLFYDQLILAIGSRPIVPENLRHHPKAITAEQILNTSEKPQKALILGAGYIGVEMAHLLSNFGVKVCLLEKKASILPTVGRTASDLVAARMKSRGIKILTKTNLSERKMAGFEKIVVCVGRKSSFVESEIPIKHQRGFIKTNQYFQTSQENIYALGDCTGAPLLAPKAEKEAAFLAENLVNKERLNKNHLQIPSCIFSEPAIGFIGQKEGAKKTRLGFNRIAASYCDHSPEGFLELYFDKKNRVIGGLVVNRHAPEVLAALTVIVRQKMNGQELSRLNFAHPTASEIIKETAKKALFSR